MTESTGNSRSITTNQTGIHDDLDAVVNKHLSTEFKKPYAPFSLTAFADLKSQVEAYLNKVSETQASIILDSCCGVGESTIRLAATHPESLVIGIDKSEHRVEKNDHHRPESVDNAIIIRADLNDLWRLIADAGWPITEHYLLYPNPWPKAKHLQRRWHGAPVFSEIPKLSKRIIVRSNWDIYIEEFSRALSLAGYAAITAQYINAQPMTPFERKYWASGQSSYQLECDFNSHLQ